MSRRAILVILAVVVVLPAAAFVAGWYWLAGQIELTLAQWALAQRNAGTELRWQSLDRSGFPFHVGVRMDGAEAAGRVGAWGWRWQGPAVDVHLRPLADDRLAFLAPGRHAVDLAGPGQQAAAIVDGKTVALAVDLAGASRIGGGTLTARAVDAATADGTFLAALREGDFAWRRIAARPAAPGAVHEAPSQTARASVAGVTLGKPFIGPAVEVLGPDIAAASVELRLDGELAPGAGPLAPALTAWRDAGGSLEVTRLAISWGPLRAEGDGTATLDADLQPEGAFALRVRGMAQLLVALERQRLIEPQAAAIARLAITAFSRPAADGTTPELQVPVTIQKRRLFLGPVALVTLPPVRWD
ncbi:MAG: DUF2125 domain-containing protein [Alphaproteobacteria bacterium]